MGWMIPFLKDDLINIKGAGVIPIGINKQFTIDENGNQILKRRLTHDASRPRISGTSINSLCDKDQLDDYQYPYCLMRLLHQIHFWRALHPLIPILINKYDLDSAYRRLHVLLQFALLCITIIGQIAYLLLRLPFGTTPAAERFCTVSETIADLTQAIVDDNTWDPNTLHSNLSELIPEEECPTTLKALQQQPFHLMVQPQHKNIKVDVYIDDIVTLVLALNKKLIERAKHGAPLALHSVFRPVCKNESIPRNAILSLRKLLGEGKLSEIKNTLGWIINTRLFTISLEEEKFLRWNKEIKDLIASCKPTTSSVLESIIGKINHAAFIIPLIRYFLTRLRYRLKVITKEGNQNLTAWDKADLKLISDMLHHSCYRGIRIDHITFCYPSLFTASDASEHGLGGFCSEYLLGDSNYLFI